MSVTLEDYHLCDSFARERKLLLYAGFYPNRNKNYLYLYYIVAFINLIISYGQLFTMIVQMYYDIDDLLKLTETLLYFFTHFTFICKLLNFQIYFKKILEIEDFLTNPIFYGFTEKQFEFIKKRISFCDLIANIFRSCCTSTITCYCLAPLVDKTKKGTLPLPGWFPYDTSRFYWSTYCFQLVSICISAYGNTGIDIITWKLASLAAAQFEILKDNLENMDFGKSNEEVKNELIKNIKHHKKIVTLNRQIQNIFSVGMFLQLFCSCGVICTNGFQLVLIPIPSSQFLFSLFYLCGMTCQIATYCWYGHDVMTSSDGIARSLHMSNWYKSSLEVRKMLIVFLENLKKPTLLKAGNFVTLSLTTFTQIMRNAYSYFAVLQRLYNDI